MLVQCSFELFWLFSSCGRICEHVRAAHGNGTSDAPVMPPMPLIHKNTNCYVAFLQPLNFLCVPLLLHDKKCKGARCIFQKMGQHAGAVNFWSKNCFLIFWNSSVCPSSAARKNVLACMLHIDHIAAKRHTMRMIIHLRSKNCCAALWIPMLLWMNRPSAETMRRPAQPVLRTYKGIEP